MDTLFYKGSEILNPLWLPFYVFSEILRNELYRRFRNSDPSISPKIPILNLIIWTHWLTKGQKYWTLYDNLFTFLAKYCGMSFMEGSEILTLLPKIAILNLIILTHWFTKSQKFWTLYDNLFTFLAKYCGMSFIEGSEILTLLSYRRYQF